MSRTTRERARKSKQSAVPKIITTVGIVAIIVAAVVAANTLNRESSAAGAAAASEAQSVAVANTAGTTAATTAGNSAANAAASGRQLLFFMNPDGYPCQVQLEILNRVADSLSRVAQVVYIKTTEPADMQKFESYGIRALPSLVIADQSGNELSRFAPGIQSADVVLAALTR